MPKGKSKTDKKTEKPKDSKGGKNWNGSIKTLKLF